MQQSRPRKCPFRHTIISRDFACNFAEEITLRDGPGIACKQAEAYQQCMDLFTAVKTAALPAFEVVDDPAQMPASILGKIQYGSLTALAHGMEQSGVANPGTANISALVSAVWDRDGSMDNLNFDEIVPVIKNYQLRRRRKR